MVIIWGVSLKMVELILLYGGAKFESYKGKLNVVLGLKECTLFISLQFSRGIWSSCRCSRCRLGEFPFIAFNRISTSKSSHILRKVMLRRGKRERGINVERDTS